MIRIKLNCAAKSAASTFANDIATMLTKNSGYKIKAKVAIASRDVYKITWYYNDEAGASDFISEVKDKLAIIDDDFEYDVNGLPILPSADYNNKRSIQPDSVMKNWSSDSSFKLFCANYGLKLTKPLHVTKQREELTGSNARAWEEATGEKIESSNFLHFITGYFEQVSQVNQTTDRDWIIKCIDMLFRYGKIYENNKKKYIEDADAYLLRDNGVRNIYKRKGSFIIASNDHWVENGKYEPTPMSDADAKKVADTAYKILDKYYPEFLDYCDIQITDGLVYITVK